MRKIIQKSVVLLILLGMLLATGCGSSIRFGTAAKGGVYYILSTEFSEILEENDIAVSAKDTAGSAANIRLLSEGYIDLGLAQSDLIGEMYFGESYGLNRNYRGYSAVAALYPEYIQIVVKEDSDIASIDDLDGCTISVGQDESGTERDAAQILSAYGLDSDQVTEVNYDYEEAMDSLLSGKIDLMFITAGIPSAILEENSGEIRFLSIDNTRRNRILSTFDGFTKATIPAGTYSGQDYDVQTIQVDAVLLAADSLSSDTVYNITKLLFENQESLESSLGLDLMEPETAGNALSIPLHPGASAWYLDQGITNTEADFSGEEAAHADN